MRPSTASSRNDVGSMTRGPFSTSAQPHVGSWVLVRKGIGEDLQRPLSTRPESDGLIAPRLPLRRHRRPPRSHLEGGAHREVLSFEPIHAKKQLADLTWLAGGGTGGT